MPTKSKHSKRHRISSRGSKETASRSSRMSMDRKVTRQAFEKREIAQEPKAINADKDKNRSAIKEVQSKMKPIQQSRRGL